MRTALLLLLLAPLLLAQDLTYLPAPADHSSLDALLAHFTFGITDAIALGAKPGFLLWMLFGLVAALPHQTQK